MYSISLSFWTRILIMDFVLLLLLLILVKYIDSISAINTRLYEIINAFAYYSVVTSIYLMINISYINCNHAEFTNISILHFHVTLNIAAIIFPLKTIECIHTCIMSHFSYINLLMVCHRIVMNSKCILIFKFNHIFPLFSELIIKVIHNNSAQCTCMYNPHCSRILPNTIYVSHPGKNDDFYDHCGSHRKFKVHVYGSYVCYLNITYEEITKTLYNIEQFNSNMHLLISIMKWYLLKNEPSLLLNAYRTVKLILPHLWLTHGIRSSNPHNVDLYVTNSTCILIDYYVVILQPRECPPSTVLSEIICFPLSNLNIYDGS